MWGFGYLVLEASRNCGSASIDINVLLQELVNLSELHLLCLLPQYSCPALPGAAPLYTSVKEDMDS